jgi:enoyl-CoA hydratase/carnithine racemase
VAALVSLERRDDKVAVVRLDRPKMNALSRQLLGELAGVVDELGADPPGAVVVWGGPRIFAAGADVSEFGGPKEAREIAALFHSTLDALAALPRATIAAINGYALGGGCELALACDLRVAGQDARLGQPEILLGIIPGGGGTQRLPRLVGPARAKELILTGRQVGPDEAVRIGLVDRVVDSDRVLGEALELAGELAGGPVLAQAAAKAAIDAGLGSPEAGMAAERRLFAGLFSTEDARAGVSSFLEKGPGKARFVGR